MSKAQAQIVWPKFEIIPVDQLFVDHDYQRELGGLADEIGEDFDPMVFNSIPVNRRTGVRGKKRYAIIDGQHRWEGAKKAHVEGVPCSVHEGLTIAQEADVFVRIQVNRRNVTSNERFRAMTKSPERYAAQVAIAAAVEAEGFTQGNAAQARAGNGTISAANALEEIYRWGAGASRKRGGVLEGGDMEAGIAFLREVLMVIREGFPRREKGYLSRDVLLGIGNLMTTADAAGYRTIDTARLIEALRTTNPDALQEKMAEIARRTGGGSRHLSMSNAVLRVYSK